LVIVTLIGKPGCHLCDEARTVIVAVCAELGVEWRELSILDHPMLADAYWDQIPIILIDDRTFAFWRITPEQLRSALTS
jgi:hypothetical protein